jgi:hypothetical protein
MAVLTGARRGDAMEREGEEEVVQEDSQLTRSATEGSARPEEVGGDGIDGERCRGRRARGGRLKASRLAWLNGEDEGVSAELQGITGKKSIGRERDRREEG